MKKSSIFYILACMTSLLLFVSCEEAEPVDSIKTDSPSPIINRSGLEDCEDCPLDYCCCAVELISMGSVDILFCDVFSGKSGTPCGPFNPGAPCGTISGSSSTIPLTSMSPRALFCVPPGGSFRMLKTMPAGNITVRISCTLNQIIPDWENVLLTTAPVYFNVDGECGLSGC